MVQTLFCRNSKGNFAGLVWPSPLSSPFSVGLVCLNRREYKSGKTGSDIHLVFPIESLFILHNSHCLVLSPGISIISLSQVRKELKCPDRVLLETNNVESEVKSSQVNRSWCWLDDDLPFFYALFVCKRRKKGVSGVNWTAKQSWDKSKEKSSKGPFQLSYWPRTVSFPVFAQLHLLSNELNSSQLRSAHLSRSISILF